MLNNIYTLTFQVCMVIDGCGWVRMDALGPRGHGEHKNKASRGHLGPRRTEFESYGRGNFPGHDVLSGC